MPHDYDQEAPPPGAGQYEQDPPVVPGSVRGYAHLHIEGADGGEGSPGPLVGWANPSFPAHLRGFWDNHSRNLKVALVLVALTIWTAAVTIGFASRMDRYDHSIKTNVPEKCTEDMVCWDCSTMGNHVCGVKP